MQNNTAAYAVSILGITIKGKANSWAKAFADQVFPAIEEDIFSVLYSDKVPEAVGLYKQPTSI